MPFLNLTERDLLTHHNFVQELGVNHHQGKEELDLLQTCEQLAKKALHQNINIKTEQIYTLKLNADLLLRDIVEGKDQKLATQAEKIHRQLSTHLAPLLEIADKRDHLNRHLGRLFNPLIENLIENRDKKEQVTFAYMRALMIARKDNEEHTSPSVKSLKAQMDELDKEYEQGKNELLDIPELKSLFEAELKTIPRLGEINKLHELLALKCLREILQ